MNFDDEYEQDHEQNKAVYKSSNEKVIYQHSETLCEYMNDKTFFDLIIEQIKPLVKSKVKQTKIVTDIIKHTTDKEHAVDLLKTLMYMNANATAPKPGLDVLLEQILTSKVDTYFYPNMYEEYEEQEKREITNMQEPVVISDGLHQCKKCKSQKTHSYSVQLRRSDEPPTIFVQCINCGANWRE